MAAITFIKKLSDESTGKVSPLVAAFAPAGIEFNFNHGGISGSYADVTFGSYVFRAVKVATVSANEDKYQLSVDWLKSLVSLPTSVTTSGMSTAQTYTVNGRNSSGTSIASASETVYITFARPAIGSPDWMYKLYTTGNVRPIYHCGKYTYFNGTTLTAATGGGYAVTGSEIAWLDREGRWSYWNFKYIGKQFDVKNSNPISTFALRNSEALGNGMNTDQEVKVQLDFKTVAIDVTHHELLCEIKQSKVVIYNGLMYDVKECTQSTGGERQNLAFNLTLEISDNAANY